MSELNGIINEFKYGAMFPKHFRLSCFADEIDPMLSKQMDVLDKTYIRHIEIRGVDGKNISEITPSEAKKIKKCLDDRGYKISAIGSPIGKININDNFAPHLELFKNVLDISEKLDAPLIRIFSFYTKNPDTDKNKVFDRLSELVKIAEDYDCVLIHENEIGIYGDTPQRNLEIAKMFPPKKKFGHAFGFVFDFANYVINGCDVMEAYNLLEDHVIYFHIKDAIYGENRVVPAGMGEGKIAEILARAKNKNCFLSLEPHLGYFEGLEAFEHTLDIKEMEKGGPHLFMIAYNALLKILKGEV